MSAVTCNKAEEIASKIELHLYCLFHIFPSIFVLRTSPFFPLTRQSKFIYFGIHIYGNKRKVPLESKFKHSWIQFRHGYFFFFSFSLHFIPFHLLQRIFHFCFHCFPYSFLHFPFPRLFSLIIFQRPKWKSTFRYEENCFIVLTLGAEKRAS